MNNDSKKKPSMLLSTALLYEKVDEVAACLAAGCDPHVMEELPFSDFHRGLQFPNEQILDLLHGGGESCLSGAADARDTHAATPLHYAAALGHTERMHELLAEGAEVDARDFGGFTPLHWAALARATAAAHVLLAAGADPNARGARGETPFMAAAWTEKPCEETAEETLQALADAGADVYARDDENASAFDYAWEEPYAADCVARRAEPASAELLDAAYAGDIERARKALARGANLHAMTYSQLSVTGMAIENQHYDLARYLISLGGVIEADSISVEEYLWNFYCKDYFDLFEHIIAHHEHHIESLDKSVLVFDTPLLCRAAEDGETRFANILLKYGADVNVKDEKGRTPLTLARQNNHTDTINLLLAHGATESSTDT